jgi:hypothetical protein
MFQPVFLQSVAAEVTYRQERLRHDAEHHQRRLGRRRTSSRSAHGQAANARVRPV